MISKGKSWAIFCAYKIDVQGLNLPEEILKEAFDASYADVATKNKIRQKLISLGGVEKGKLTPSPAEHATLHAKALEAAITAAAEHTPTPMVVQQHASVDDFSPVVQEWNVPDGVCGFAWVKVPGNTSFGKWAKKQGIFKKSYEGGLTYWISDYNQSMEKKEAHAKAYAKTLQEAGIKAYAYSRMD